MGVREFTANDHEIVFSGGAIGGATFSGPYTAVVLFKPNAVTTNMSLLTFHDLGTSTPLTMYTGGTEIVHGGDGGDEFCAVGIDDDTWAVVAVRKADGNVAPRGSHVTLGPSGTATHDTSGAAYTETAGTIDTIVIGEQFAITPNYRLALAALFNFELSDEQIRRLGFVASTDYLRSLGPIWGVELNQDSIGAVTDFTGGGGDKTSEAGTTVVTGDDPPWLFTGSGAVRGFAGGDALNPGEIVVDDGGVGDLSGQAFTYVALISTDETGGSDRAIVSSGVSGTSSASMGRSASSVAYYDTNEVAYPAAGLGITAGTWFVVALSKASGTATPRGHAKQLGGGSWVHSTSATSVTPTSGSVTEIVLGQFADGGSGFLGRIAVIALFLSELSDGAIESIETNASTEFLASLSPFALWDLNQTDVTDDVLDLIGSADQTSRVATYVETGDEPAWAFGLTPSQTVYQVLSPTVGGRW